MKKPETRGRKPRADAATRTLTLRLTTSELDALRIAAKIQGLDLSAYIRRVAFMHAQRVVDAWTISERKRRGVPLFERKAGAWRATKIGGNK